jgi:hypothetical protein
LWQCLLIFLVHPFASHHLIWTLTFAASVDLKLRNFESRVMKREKFWYPHDVALKWRSDAMKRFCIFRFKTFRIINFGSSVFRNVAWPWVMICYRRFGKAESVSCSRIKQYKKKKILHWTSNLSCCYRERA